ncbi:unnamed protein product [Prunus armeniaca]|uniref:Uncharacterized protein n=1 Tax=Prunus armeniaca TaxID=36596 RepID=A0A6J5Y6R4_PRUAR|nr:unnamed protein product [Prunus armeniaca]
MKVASWIGERRGLGERLGSSVGPRPKVTCGPEGRLGSEVRCGLGEEGCGSPEGGYGPGEDDGPGEEGKEINGGGCPAGAKGGG